MHRYFTVIKINTNKLILTLLAGLSLSLGGCATVGESEFKCKGYPSGLPCTSVGEMYELTDDDDYQQKIDEASRQFQERQENGEEDTGIDAKDLDQTSRALPPKKVLQTIIPDHSRAVVPLRTPAKVMRIQIRPWESDDNVFSVPGYHYVEIEKRRWMIGNKKLELNPTLISVNQNQEPDPEED